MTGDGTVSFWSDSKIRFGMVFSEFHGNWRGGLGFVTKCMIDEDGLDSKVVYGQILVEKL